MEEYMKKKTKQHLWTFLISKLIASLGTSIYSFGISFYILSFTGSALSFAINLILNVLPRALFSPIVGYMADKYNKKVIIVSSQFGSALVMITLLLYSLANGISLYAIYAATALISITSAFSSSTFNAAIPHLVDHDSIQKAMSFNQISISLAAIGGPTLGGLLYGFLNLPIFIAIFIFAYIIAAFLDMTMDFTLYSNKSDRPPSDEKESMLNGIMSGINYLRNNELIFRIVIIALCINFFFGATTVGFSYILIDLLKVDSTHFGFVEASASFGTLAASIYVGIHKTFKSPLTLSKWGIIFLATLMTFVSLPLLTNLGYWGNLSYYTVLHFVFGSIIVFVNTPLLVMVQSKVLEDYRGRVFSLIETASLALTPLGMLIYGLLYDLLHPAGVLITSGLSLVVLVVLLMPTSLLRKYSVQDKPAMETKSYN